ncbi:flagellar hook assembly protein FlgD [Virgibacillus kimchii]
MTKIDPSLYLQNQQSDRTPSPELGKDEFLQILMVQLQNQDPTNPMEDREFISQMTQFSSLEQMMNMTNSIDTLVQSQMISPVIQYSHMIGKEVSYQGYDEEKNTETGLETSRVISVSQNDGWAIFELENGEEIYAEAVLQVNEGSAGEESNQD